MMRLNVWGGAGEHGRSCYWIGNDERSILLDCGVKREGIGIYPLLDPAAVAGLDAVFLSHAHEDHSMAIPLLYKLGYKGMVWTTRITAELLPGYYASWSRYVQQQGGTLPYSEADIAHVEYAYLEDISPPLQWAVIFPGLRVCWGRSGHMLGSVWLLLELNGKRLFYSGDYSEESLLIATDSPQDAPGGVKDLDGAIVDAAYGMDAEGQAKKLEQLYARAEAVLAAGGQLLLPVPVSGRGQELLLLLGRRFPETPLWVESELIHAMDLLLRHPGWLRPGMSAVLAKVLSSGRFEVVRDAEQRTRLLGRGQPAPSPGIWFTSDGMMQSAKAAWYYEQLRNYPGSGILITGHVAKDTLAEQLLGMNEEQRGCLMEVIRYKIHQGLPDVRKMSGYLSSTFTLLVHAPKPETDILLQQLTEEGQQGLLAMHPGVAISL